MRKYSKRYRPLSLWSVLPGDPVIIRDPKNTTLDGLKGKIAQASCVANGFGIVLPIRFMLEGTIRKRRMPCELLELLPIEGEHAPGTKRLRPGKAVSVVDINLDRRPSGRKSGRLSERSSGPVGEAGPLSENSSCEGRPR